MATPKKIWSILLMAEIFILAFVSGFMPVKLITGLNALMFILIYFTSAMSISTLNKKFFILVWISMGLQILSQLFDYNEFVVTMQIVNIFFFSAIVGLLINRIARAKSITESVIFEAINGYLLLGVLFAAMVGLMFRFDPTSFSFNNISEVRNNEFIYFSFVTITTLGYGDVLPVQPYAKSLAMLAAVTGQLYLTIIIALLVGKYSNQLTQ
ncbi:potassium channel family protein [Fulvivirga sedimenti]|uniref:Potassium channel family protein n=1 Tax=Fulvivirga sedimenti TaxID=2879465 RepID=A0A9X1HN12_9BACT|nr:potassium channel family protein [Fulvivirga sedimenti]MCA6074925.1 potassium channel family protein [Fulvivirga sedimenti]MCA6076102.1 potassium channel family protein [Fulvivirga sedimenti]MCA6077230.1 potassium channel family protein [Fulvivirga sedimenti]